MLAQEVWLPAVDTTAVPILYHIVAPLEKARRAEADLGFIQRIHA
jgi:hypothetical protein